MVPAFAAGDIGYPFPPNPFREDLSIHPLRRAREAAAKINGGAGKPTDVGGFFRELPGANRVRNLHLVDFGRELEHSPDGRAQAVAHGSEGDKPAEGSLLLESDGLPARLPKAANWEPGEGACPGFVRAFKVCGERLEENDHEPQNPNHLVPNLEIRGELMAAATVVNLTGCAGIGNHTPPAPCRRRDD